MAKQISKSRWLNTEKLMAPLPCYCSQCKKPLSESRVLDEHLGWCPTCQSIVDTSWFQMEGWVIGATVFLLGNLMFVILA